MPDDFSAPADGIAAWNEEARLPQDCDGWLQLALQQVSAGHHAESRASLTRLLTMAPEQYPAVVAIADNLMSLGQRDAAYACIEVAVDAALLESQFGRAADMLESFLRHGVSVPALRKLVEVTCEPGFEEARRDAEGRLAAAMAGEGDPTAHEHSSTTSAKDLDAIFEEMRAGVRREQQMTDADAHYTRGLEYLLGGRIAEAVDDLQAAARTPLLRFTASAQLGRLYVERGDLATGVEWLERAAEAPAPTPDDGVALLYELADTLQRMGESARALAVLIELDATAGEYRDVRRRIEELTRVEAGGPAA